MFTLDNSIFKTNTTLAISPGRNQNKTMLIKFDIWRIITVYNLGNHHHSSERGRTILYKSVILKLCQIKSELMISWKILLQSKYFIQCTILCNGDEGCSLLVQPCQPQARMKNQPNFVYNVLQETFSLLPQ